MDFAFTKEQEMLREQVCKFVARECPKEFIRRSDEEQLFPMELFRKMGQLGWMGIPYPEEYGGSGGSPVDLVLLLEELAMGMRALASAYYTTVILGGEAIFVAGSETQKKEFISRVCQGEILLSLALTEPNAGSDLGSLTTSAVEDGDHYTINGQKVFITGSDVADYMVLAARTDRQAAKHKGITLFLVDTHSKGITMRRMQKLGIRAISANEIFLENVRVPRANMLGGLNEGWKNIMKTLEMERLSMAACSVGDAQAAVNEALQYAKERVQFGQPIGKFQMVQEMLADMQMEVDAARLLTCRAAWMLQQGMKAIKETSFAKLFSSEAGMRVANKGLQVMGGYGYMMEYDMQRHFRDAKINEIGGGSSQIQRLIIAREMGL